MNLTYLEELLTNSFLRSYSGNKYHIRNMVCEAINQAKNKVDILSELKENLKIGVVHFEYLKADNSIREAWGTLSDTIIESYNHEFSGNNKGNSPVCFRYFDLQRKEWRCFNINNFRKIIE